MTNNNNLQPQQDHSTDAATSADNIINHYTMASGLLGLVPVPLVDLVALSVIQCRMIKRLCQTYGHRYSENQTKTWIAAIAGGYASTAFGSRLLLSWFKFIPGVGIATSASAAAITYALGLGFKRHFAQGGSPQTVDVKAMGTQYQDDLKTAQQREQSQPKAVAEPTAVVKLTTSAETKTAEPKISESKTPEPATTEQVQQPSETEANDGDDLTLVEGIGPKVHALFQSNGITTFEQLANCEVDKLQQMLDAVGGRFKVCRPKYWPEQAKLAAQGNWTELNRLKASLKNGYK